MGNRRWGNSPFHIDEKWHASPYVCVFVCKRCKKHKNTRDELGIGGHTRQKHGGCTNIKMTVIFLLFHCSFFTNFLKQAGVPFLRLLFFGYSKPHTPKNYSLFSLPRKLESKASVLILFFK